MKVLFATKNPAKIKYYSSNLQAKGIEVISLNDIDLEIEVEENGKTPTENAKIKAKACYEKTHFPTIAVDDGLFLDGLSDEEQPNTHVRRVNGKRLNDEEMIDYYSVLAKRFGGKIKGNWIHGIAVCKDEKVYTFERKTNVIMTSNVSPFVTKGYPLDSISIVPMFNKYRSELTKEELEEEKEKSENEMGKVFDFIEECIKKTSFNKI